MLFAVGRELLCMDKDTIAIVLVIVSATGLLATANLAWFLLFIVSSAYGGWRLGQRIMPPEKHGV